jgi:8-oxo-dGTP diphosphatase
MVQNIVCTGFVYHQEKTLIIQRSLHETFLPGFYELPGGKVDFGEDPVQALKREFREEVNLHVEVKRPYKTFSYVSDNGKRHTVEIVYQVELHDDPSRIRLSEAHSAYQWIYEKEVGHYLLSAETKDSILQGFHLSG